MEPNTELDIWANWLMSRYQVRLALTRACGVLSYRNNNALRYNLKYATIMARIQYRRFKDPLPPANDPRKMGEYWKAAFNKTGKGTVEEFVGNYMHYCKE